MVSDPRPLQLPHASSNPAFLRLPPQLPPRAATVRLTRTAKSVGTGLAGRLEVKYRGAWVAACASGFTNAASSVICKQASRLFSVHGSVSLVAAVPGSSLDTNGRWAWLLCEHIPAQLKDTAIHTILPHTAHSRS